jgi:hypothetical protein
MTVRFNHRQKALIESQEQLNKMLLVQGERDKLQSRRADLGATFVRLGRGNFRLRVFNKGKATAHNVRLDFPDGCDVVIQSEIDEKFPLEALEQHQSVDLIASATLGSKLKYAIRFYWADEESTENQKTVYATI